MPSFLIGNRPGGDVILSGQNYGSGGVRLPRTGVQLRLDRAASGNAYVGLSGNLTINSGMISVVSGGPNSGLLDGMEMGPGDAYFIPAAAFPSSGTFNVFASCDAACSGQARLFFDVWMLMLAFGFLGLCDLFV